MAKINRRTRVAVDVSSGESYSCFRPGERPGPGAATDRPHRVAASKAAVPHSTVFNARNAAPPPSFEVKAPANAPNILIILLDDRGFGQSSAFGGPVHMPTVESLANNGLRYSEFHTTALCSPTRSALLSGRNHHMNNFGSIAETATAFPGQTGQRPNSVASIAEMLRLNGYGTAAFGKNHETAPWEVSPSGPTDRWPTRGRMFPYREYGVGRAGFLAVRIPRSWGKTIPSPLATVQPELIASQ